jgi:protein-tyrosine phosphatase
MLKRTDATAEDMREAMLSLYRVIPVDHAASYRAMFAQIANGRVPILINCSAGKDRTGVGAALILAALGVPRETIVADYLLTNEHADWNWLLAQRNTLVARARRVRPEVLEPLLTVDVAYLDALFAVLDERHGGVDGYLTQALGVDEAARKALRTRLLD